MRCDRTSRSLLGAVVAAVTLTLSHAAMPTLVEVAACAVAPSPSDCWRTRAGLVVDEMERSLSDRLDEWGVEADREMISSGRQISELPSVAGRKLMIAGEQLFDILRRSRAAHHGSSSSEARKKSGGGGEASITISSGGGGGDKHKKDKKKKHKKPAQLHLHQQQQQQQQEDEDKGVVRTARVDQEDEVDEDSSSVATAQTHIKREGGFVEDGRGKKKKRKKAILKLLILGAVLKAKISLLLQLFSAHLQVKFFAIALAGLALNIAKFWFDLKKGHQPQKVIYYEHAQHQHHYEQEDDHGWGGYWSRSIDEGPVKTKVHIPNISYPNVEEIIPTVEESHADDLAYGGWNRGFSRR